MTNDQYSTRLFVTVQDRGNDERTVYGTLDQASAVDMYQTFVADEPSYLTYVADVTVMGQVENRQATARKLAASGIHHRDLIEYHAGDAPRGDEDQLRAERGEHGPRHETERVDVDQLSAMAETGAEQPYVVFDVLHPQWGSDVPIATAELTPDEAQQAGWALILAAATARTARELKPRA